MHAYLNEGDKVHECYSCLKRMIQAHLHIGFPQDFSLNGHHLNKSICIWYCCNQAQFLNKKIIMKCLAIKIFCIKFFFTIPNSKNIIGTLRIVTIEKPKLTFLLILYPYYISYIILHFHARFKMRLVEKLLLPLKQLNNWVIYAKAKGTAIISSTYRKLFLFCEVAILEIVFRRNPTRIILSKFICTLE